jgi:hypothetical protein
MPRTERVRVRIVKLHPVAEGRLEPGKPFPILVERIASDGTTTSLSTVHAFDLYGEPFHFFAADDGGIWFQPRAWLYHETDNLPVFGGDQLAVDGDGSAWLSNGDTLAHIAPDGTPAFYRAPGKTIAKLVGGSGRSVLALDGFTHDVYRIDGDRSTWLVGRFPTIPTLDYLQQEGRDAMWFPDGPNVSEIAGDASEVRTIEVRVPRYTEPLCGDGNALWLNTRVALNKELPFQSSILTRYAIDGTVSRFQIAYSLPLSANTGPAGHLLLEAAIPGGDFLVRHFFEFDPTGRATQTDLPDTQTRGGNGIARLRDGAFVVGWDQQSFATIEPHGGVGITEIPRP